VILSPANPDVYIASFHTRHLIQLQVVLVFQGGGALGAYQAGAFFTRVKAN
jgi:predicted acylesterase/phospholipase RssA